MAFEICPPTTTSAMGREVHMDTAMVDQQGQLLSEIDHVLHLTGKSNRQTVLGEGQNLAC